MDLLSCSAAPRTLAALLTRSLNASVKMLGTPPPGLWLSAVQRTSVYGAIRTQELLLRSQMLDPLSHGRPLPPALRSLSDEVEERLARIPTAMKVYFFLDGSRITSPATVKVPRPMWWSVRARLTERSIQAFTTSRTNAS